MTKTPALLSNLIKPLLESRLPDWVEPHWFMTKDEALELAPKAGIAWVDLYDKQEMFEVISHAQQHQEQVEPKLQMY